MGISDIKKYNIEDLIKGDVIFVASAITDGSIVNGVKDLGNKYEVSTFTLHKDERINKRVNNIHKK